MNTPQQLSRARPAGQPRPAAAVTAGLAAVLALVGCGSTAGPGSGQAAPPARVSPTAQARAIACKTTELQVTLDLAAAGVAAGSSYVPLEFTNASASACTLAGYPAVVFSSGVAGPQIGSAGSAQVSTHTSTLVLAPGGVAHAWLQILDVANYPSGQCKPVQASGLRVSFGGTQTAAYLAHPFQACQNVLRGSDVLAVFPVQPGRARRGTAP